jgi:hypothetical protein
MQHILLSRMSKEHLGRYDRYAYEGINIYAPCPNYTEKGALLKKCADFIATIKTPQKVDHLKRITLEAVGAIVLAFVLYIIV